MVQQVDRISILIVDDADDVRRDLRTVFQLTPDLEVVGEATQGLEAVALAEQLRPDVVLMDLRMPGLDGFEATRRIKGNNLARSVVILTIYGEDEQRARAAALGADSFVEKAAGVERLLAEIRRIARPPAATDAQGEPMEVAHGV